MTLVTRNALVVVIVACVVSFASAGDFLIGRGIYDVTGPAANVNMMGYANAAQTTHGIHFRIRSRAFIFVDPQTEKRVVFVSVDCGMASQIMKDKVMEQITAKYGDLYTVNNVAISGTHTHSTPAGMLQYTLFQITSLGYVKESIDAFVDGIVASINMAHDNIQPGNMFINEGEVEDANISRSPTAYANNPAWERAMYKYNTDHGMTLVRMEADDGTPIGMVNWYAVHGTSMNNTNELISGDNKGYAAMKFEEAMNGPDVPPGMGPFVASFAQTNLGDVSPNTRGPYCYKGPYAGQPCDRITSTCGGKNEYCVGRGPGDNMFESTRIIGQRQLDVAQDLFNTATTPLNGTVDYIHMFVDMSNQTVMMNGSEYKTCKTAMGYAFAAGTTDGPGMFNFHQGTVKGNPFWNLIRDVIATPSPEMIACQHPKPILLATGECTFPYAWDPEIVEVQLLKVGQLFIVVVPGEFTTMAGRRTRRMVMQTLQQYGIADENSKIVIAGLANTYASYVTTYEEYQIQRYEGASTIYGPHELQAYIQIYQRMAEYMARGYTPPNGTPPPNLSSKQLEFLPPVIVDGTPIGKHFGDVSSGPADSYVAGSTASVTFYTGCPRNNLRTQGTFLTVDRQATNGTWEVVFNDGAWDTKFHWYRTDEISDVSYAECVWDIANTTAPGTYRITHYGTAKGLFGKMTDFTGVSPSFKVTAPADSE